MNKTTQEIYGITVVPGMLLSLSKAPLMVSTAPEDWDWHAQSGKANWTNWIYQPRSILVVAVVGHKKDRCPSWGDKVMIVHNGRFWWTSEEDLIEATLRNQISL